MTRKEEIKQYCIEQGFPQGACSSILEVKAIVATEAIKWADKTMIEKACEWIQKEVLEDYQYVIWPDIVKDFRKAMEE